MIKPAVNSKADWATRGGDAWSRRWQEIDGALSDLAAKLHDVLIEAAPASQFRALDIGCGAGATSQQLAAARPEAMFLGCDLSPALIEVARDRLAGHRAARFVVADAEAVAASEGPFDLFFSRHGVMFFEDPVRAFRAFRRASAPDAGLVFSCFRDWQANPWASDLACAAAGRPLPPPGREPSGFAFAEPDHVRQILHAGGWNRLQARPVDFLYVAASGAGAADRALDFLAEIGPASRAMLDLAEGDRAAALDRMRTVIERYTDGRKVEFPAAAWIWSATARD